MSNEIEENGVTSERLSHVLDAVRTRTKPASVVAVVAGCALVGAAAVGGATPATSGGPVTAVPAAVTTPASPAASGAARPTPPPTAASLAAGTAEPSAKPTAAATTKAGSAAVKKTAKPEPAAKTSSRARTSQAPRSTPEPAPESKAPVRAAVSGSRYTTTGVNVRTAPDVDSRRVTTLAPGRKVAITPTVEDGFRRIVLSGEARWVRATYLSTEKPDLSEASDRSDDSRSDTSDSKRSGDSRSGDSRSDDNRSDDSRSEDSRSDRSGDRSTSGSRSNGSSGSGLSSARCAAAAGIEGGITRSTVRVLRAVCARFPQVTSYGGYRAGGGSAHNSGRAIDAMVSSSSTGWEIARWVRANARSLGVTEVIWSQQIWTTQRAGEGWRGMPDRGSASANHYDHVHITVG